MTKYLDDKFSVPLGGKKYRDNWEEAFGKKKVEEKIEKEVKEEAAEEKKDE